MVHIQREVSTGTALFLSSGNQEVHKRTADDSAVLMELHMELMEYYY